MIPADLEGVDAVELRRLLGEARETIDDLSADLHTALVELADLRSTRQAEHRTQHPSTHPITLTHPSLRDRLDVADACPPHGFERPFKIIRGGVA